ncbi:MAG: hypothetical protein OXC93_12795, partial [Rhodospirillaceae bacterium]|nr:hypothetical protein [Rhodospirillaceae bacterium]
RRELSDNTRLFLSVAGTPSTAGQFLGTSGHWFDPAMTFASPVIDTPGMKNVHRSCQSLRRLVCASDL